MGKAIRDQAPRLWAGQLWPIVVAITGRAGQIRSDAADGKLVETALVGRAEVRIT